MTENEFNNLKIGDIVYSYKTVNPKYLSSINAGVTKKIVKSINLKKDRKVIGLEHGGIIMDTLLNGFDTDKNKLIYLKLKDIKKKLFKLKQSQYKDVVSIRAVEFKLEKILNQKNVKKVLELYPEILI